MFPIEQELQATLRRATNLLTEDTSEDPIEFVKVLGPENERS